MRAGEFNLIQIMFCSKISLFLFKCSLYLVFLNVAAENTSDTLESSELIQNSLRNYDENISANISSFHLETVFLFINKLPRGNCHSDILILLKAIENKEKWALQMYDASAKIPVGFLHGNLYQLGNFDQCITVRQSMKMSRHDIQGQYCLADINSLSDKKFVSRNMFDEMMHLAICVPSTCNYKEVELLLTDLVPHMQTYFKNFTVTIPPNRCYFPKQTPLTSLDIIYGVVLGFILVIILTATGYHIIRLYSKSKCIPMHEEAQPKKKIQKAYHKAILSFSVVHNIDKVFNAESKDLSLECVCGIKCIVMLFIIAGHGIVFAVSAPVINTDFHTEALAKFQNGFIINNPLLVDTFLCLSGFLFAYLLLLELDKRKGKVNFLFLFIARYVRLTPAYFAIIAFYTTFLPRLGSGPLWDDRMIKEQERCQKSWWANILYINNYVSNENLCMFQSWYLAVDTQLFIITSFILYPLWKWRKLGETLLGCCTFMSIIIPAIITYVYKLDPTLMVYAPEIVDLAQNPYFINAYIKTHMRASAYFVGITTGYILYKIKSKNIEISNTVAVIGWLMALVCGITSMFSITIFYLPDHRYNVLESAVYSALDRVAWCAFVGWFMVACISNKSGPIKQFLSWKPFVVISRLTYSAYLVNGLIELYTYGSTRSPLHMSIYTLLCHVLSHVILTVSGAIILLIIFESPIINLQRMLLHKVQ